MARILSLVAGKATVGKTGIALNLAAQLARQGQRVCVLDLGSEGADLCQQLGLQPPVRLRELALGETRLESLLVHDRRGFDLVPGGGDWLQGLDAAAHRRLAEALAALCDYDFLLIDAPAGNERNALAFALAASEILLVITPYAGSLDRAWSLLKLLYAEQYQGPVRVIVNSVNDHASGRQCYDKFHGVNDFYLELDLSLLGLVRKDSAMGQAFDRHGIAVIDAPESMAAIDLRYLADRLLAADDAPQARPQEVRQAYLRAAGLLAVPEVAEMELAGRAASPSDDDLHLQLEYLSVQVEQLIGEVTRLRDSEPGARGNEAREERPPAVAAQGDCGIAALASASEQVVIDGEAFTLYRLDRPGAGPLHFACHGAPDEVVEADPRVG